MLIGDPLYEGSNASSTDNELWRAENSFLRMRGNSPFFLFFFISRSGGVYVGYSGIREE